jgi:four helix bundle protein
MQDFRNLKVWQAAHAVALEIYRDTSKFPREELFGLTVQSKRAGASVPANIAEGCGRGSDRDFRRFLQIAMGSACEVEYHVLLAKDLNYLLAEAYARLAGQIDSIKRMLTSLIGKLSVDGSNPTAESRRPKADSR